MPMRLPMKSGPVEVVEMFVCTDPKCPSHKAEQPAAVIRWNEGETERAVACTYCYHESWIPAQFEMKDSVKNGVAVQLPVSLIKDAEKVAHGVVIVCKRGAGALEVERDSLTYEVTKTLRS